MGLKKYSALSIIYMLAIGGFTYYQNAGVMTVNILDYYTQDAYIALLVVLPVAVFFILSLMHILMYGFKNYIKDKNSKKDTDKLEKYLQSLILSKNSKEVFFNKDIQEIANFINHTTFAFNQDKVYKTGMETVNDALEVVKKIHDGEHIEKLEKTFGLEEKNELVIKNQFNKFNKNNKFYIEVLKEQEQYNKDIVEFAFLKAIDHENFGTIEKNILDVDISKQAVIKILRLYENEQNTLKEKDYFSILRRAKLSSDQYIEVVKAIKSHINPDKLIVLMDKICDKDEQAIKSYIYLLLDLEIIDKAKELLESVDVKDGEYAKFKTYLNTKDSGAQCSIADFI